MLGKTGLLCSESLKVGRLLWFFLQHMRALGDWGYGTSGPRNIPSLDSQHALPLRFS
jgi:hypothetical protein